MKITKKTIKQLIADLSGAGILTGAATLLHPGWQDEYYAETKGELNSDYGVLDRAAEIVRERISPENFSDVEKLVAKGQALRAKIIDDEVERQAQKLLRQRRLGTILAAIRLWQKTVSNDPRIEQSLEDIATDCGSFEPLDVVEMDELCEALNCGDLLNHATDLTQRYENIYVDIPVKENLDDDDGAWTNVGNFHTIPEALEFIREKIGPCDDAGRVQLITLGAKA